MCEVCGDNRFELIEKYKTKLCDGTNIEMAKDEMTVIDSILFRFWQMGWLGKLEETDKSEWISVEERLPERSGKYLVATFDGRVGIGNLIDYYCDGDLSFDNYKVTHWMPLPMPPKGDVGR